MSTPRAKSSATVPALIAKLGGGKGGGLTFPRALSYDSEKPGSEFIWTNLETMDKAAWNRQAEAFRALAPRLRRSVDHWSLSLDKRHGTLSQQDWTEAAKAFLADLGYEGCAAVVHRHVHDNDHIHIAVQRVRLKADGKVETVSDSHIYRRSHIASERAARKIGLKPLPPRNNAAEAPAPTDSQVAANKHATRRGTSVVKPAALAKAFESAVARSATVEELVTRCAEIGIEVEVKTKEPSMTIQGLRVRPVAVQEWTKASELKRDRSLSWSKLESRLLRNGELRARAQAEADRINAAARESAAARVAARLANEPEHQLSDPARALMPIAVNQAKEATTMNMNDTLHLMSPSPPPQPADVPIDDVPLDAPSVSVVSAVATKQAQEERAAAQARSWRFRSARLRPPLPVARFTVK